MRPTKNIIQTVKNRSLDEPVYVDEVFPEELSQDDPWVRKEKLDAEEEELENPEATLDFEEDEEVDVPVQPPPVKPTPPPRSYRVKMPQPAQRLPDNRRLSIHKSLPTELPRPILKQRREDRTGTWPVEPEPRRNGTTHPKNGHASPPIPTERGASTNPLTPKERTTLPERFTPPAAPAPPVDWETERETPPVIERRSPTRQQPESIAPPPILPVTPIKTTASQRVFPVEDVPDPSQQLSDFRPLVDESSDEELETQERGWEQIDPTRARAELHDLIERLSLPQNSLILGVCDDGLPLVLELSDPSPGALLFLGDDVDGLRKHLHAVMTSVCLLSDPKQVQVDLISPAPETFAAQKLFPHVQKFHLPDHEEVFGLLGCLFELIEQRQRKDNSLTGKLLKEFLPPNKAPVRILMIDQLDVLVEQLAPESLAYLRWLLRRGPAANVWVLASLNAQNAQAVDGKTLKSFGLQVVSKMRNTRQASRLTDIPLEKLSTLAAGKQACMKLEEDVIEFSILET